MTDDDKAKAIRKARYIASDISAYNEAKIIQGIEQDSFFETLKDELDQGRDEYRAQVSPDVFGETSFYFFDRAVVDVILARKGHIKSKIW
jgi:hypothetical protein